MSDNRSLPLAFNAFWMEFRIYKSKRPPLTCKLPGRIRRGVHPLLEGAPLEGVVMSLNDDLLHTRCEFCSQAEVFRDNPPSGGNTVASRPCLVGDGPPLNTFRIYEKSTPCLCASIWHIFVIRSMPWLTLIATPTSILDIWWFHVVLICLSPSITINWIL